MTNTSRHTLELTDGRSLQLTVAEPEGSVRAGVVVFHEAGGVTDTVLAQLSWLADEGWLAVTPHIYRQPDDADAGAEASTLTSESVLADADATCVWLGQHGVPDDMIGVVGFGLGGTAAMLVAASRTVGAAVSVAPHDRAPATAALPALDELAGELACPWLGVFDERDGRVDADEVDSLREAATASEIATEVVRLPGASKHFDAEPDSRTQAWQRTVNWFDSNLR